MSCVGYSFTLQARSHVFGNDKVDNGLIIIIIRLIGLTYLMKGGAGRSVLP